MIIQMIISIFQFLFDFLWKRDYLRCFVDI